MLFDHFEPIDMTTRKVLWAYFALVAIYGACLSYFGAQGGQVSRLIEFVFLAATTVMIYVWYYVDAAEQRFRRTPLLGGAVIMLSIIAIPVYLVRSRPRGKRVVALLRFLGLLLLTPVVAISAGLPFVFL